MTKPPVLAAAMRLAGTGRPVFPCRTGGKEPLGELVAHGLNDASTDPAIIRAWFTSRPEANLALRTGAISRLVVLDVDGDQGADALRALEREHDPLPRTTSVKTPSGGSHFYFRHPGVEVRNSASQIGDHLDIRGEGGYVLVPPSSIGGRPYTPDDTATPAALPSWLLDLFTGTTRAGAKGNAVTAPGEWAQILRGVPAGRRNSELARLAGYLLARGRRGRSRVEPLLAREIVLQAARNCRLPLDEAEAVRIVASIAGRELLR